MSSAGSAFGVEWRLALRPSGCDGTRGRSERRSEPPECTFPIFFAIDLTRRSQDEAHRALLIQSCAQLPVDFETLILRPA